jgi:hypothetical protein
MDTWQADQIKRMQVGNCMLALQSSLTCPKLGGNAPFRQFIESYTPTDQGGYKQGTSVYDTYYCWAASQYREKVCRLPYLRFLTELSPVRRDPSRQILVSICATSII